MFCPCFVFCVNDIDVGEDDDHWCEYMITLNFIDFMTLENFLVSRGPRNSPEISPYLRHKVGVFHSSGYSYSCFLCTLLNGLRY